MYSNTIRRPIQNLSIPEKDWEKAKKAVTEHIEKQLKPKSSTLNGRIYTVLHSDCMTRDALQKLLDEMNRPKNINLRVNSFQKRNEGENLDITISVLPHIKLPKKGKQQKEDSAKIAKTGKMKLASQIKIPKFFLKNIHHPRNISPQSKSINHLKNDLRDDFIWK